MTGCLEANLSLLSLRQPELARCLAADARSDRIEVIRSFKGIPTALYRRSDSSVIAINSRHDPLQEARLSLRQLDLSGADYFILLGFGLGYVLDAILEQCSRQQRRYFIVESDLQILRAAFESRDLRTFLLLPHIHFAWPALGPELAAQWRTFFDPVCAQKSIFVSHLPSLVLSPALFKSAVEVIQSETFQIFTDINTLVGKSRVFLDNFVENLPRAISSPGVCAFAGFLHRTPAVVVAAGPSLDKNCYELRAFEERVLIVATDTALRPLRAAGVRPHFVLTGDPTHENFLHLKGALPENSLLVAEVTAHPSAFVEFTGRTVTCTFENSSLHSLSDLLGNKGTLRAWGSVATMGLDFALLLGCDPVIFVGQDLAHSEGRTYCSGLYFENDWFAGRASPGEWNRQWEVLRAGKKTLAMQDIFGRPVETTDKLVAYWNWITKEINRHPKVHFINATEGGILRDGITLSSLREALHRYCQEDRKLSSTILARFANAQQEKWGIGRNALSRLSDESSSIKETLARASQMCAGDVQDSPSNLFGHLEAIRESIYSGRHIAPILDCFNQMGNFTFLRKREDLILRGGDATLPSAIMKTYGEYFESVLFALARVESALARIEKALAASRGTSYGTLESAGEPSHSYAYR